MYAVDFKAFHEGLTYFFHITAWFVRKKKFRSRNLKNIDEAKIPQIICTLYDKSLRHYFLLTLFVF